MEQEQIKGPDQGLGDTIARFTAATRIDKLAQRIAKAVGAKDCGCAERKELLNEMFPYKKNPQENNETT
jgi:hypothetical protein